MNKNGFDIIITENDWYATKLDQTKPLISRIAIDKLQYL